MKFSEMNVHQQIATRMAFEVMGSYIGGLENTMSDYSPESSQYQSAKETLETPHDEMVDFLYWMVMEETGKGYLKHMRFAGKEFIKERISNRLKKWGY